MKSSIRSENASRGRRGGPNNQIAMKSDQSVRPPPREDRVCVVVPKDFNQALLNVAKNGERLFIVHVHRHKHIRRKGNVLRSLCCLYDYLIL
jgi:hypothetical protein